MYENLTEFSVDGLAHNTSLEGAYVLLLREKRGKTIIPIPIDGTGYERVKAAVERNDFTCSHMMLQLAEAAGLTLFCAMVLPPEGGLTKGRLNFVEGGSDSADDDTAFHILDVPIADAVVTALEAGCGLWVHNSMADLHRKRNSPEGTMALPLRGMADELLRNALEEAVGKDDFELAAHIRDELKSRTQEGD